MQQYSLRHTDLKCCTTRQKSDFPATRNPTEHFTLVLFRLRHFVTLEFPANVMPECSQKIFLNVLRTICRNACTISRELFYKHSQYCQFSTYTERIYMRLRKLKRMLVGRPTQEMVRADLHGLGLCCILNSDIGRSSPCIAAILSSYYCANTAVHSRQLVQEAILCS